MINGKATAFNFLSFASQEYNNFWWTIFAVWGLTMDANLKGSLQARDTQKKNKKERAETKVGKIVRGRARNEKFSEAKRDYFEQL